MYDMYHWHRMDSSADENGSAATTRNGDTPHAGSRHAGPAARAVQVALDRRDNGGDLGAARDE